jgi:hypothetical protein
MKRRIARGGAVTLLVLAMAITPMTVVFSAGHFETHLPGGLIGHSQMSATLQDATGLVRAISASPWGDEGIAINPGGNRYVLSVSWTGGCGDAQASFTFRRDGSGYVITERTLEWGCFYMIGIGRSLAIYLWSPVDAATVRFESD